MEIIISLTTNTPVWIARLDELSSQIDQRQKDLARLDEEQSLSSSSSGALTRAKSVRNKGSTESLKPRDEVAMLDGGEGMTSPATSPTSPGAADAMDFAADLLTAAAGPSSAEDPHSTSALQHQTNQVMQVATARARATLQRRNVDRSDSMLSAEGAMPRYRTRNMIIVYYDSYVQSFFEELVKFVSASRNLMRRAKMAAKVAHIKRMAELEMLPDTAAEDDGAAGEASAGTESKTPLGVDGDRSGSTENTAAQPTAQPTALSASSAPSVPSQPSAALALELAAAPATSPGQVVGTGPIEVDESEGTEADTTPILTYVSSRRFGRGADGGGPMLPAGIAARMAARTAAMGAMATPSRRLAAGAAGGISGSSSSIGDANKDQAPGIYDELDKGLEYVQSMCERAAHQFLRDGDCSDEIANMKRRLLETKELAESEVERLKKEDPDALKAISQPAKSRSYRLQSMRKEVALAPASAKDGAGADDFGDCQPGHGY